MIPISKPQIGQEEKNAVLNTLSSGYLIQGERVNKFEENFNKYIGVKYAVAVNSGTSALYLSLLSLGIKKGDEVITTPFSFIASSNCILYCNARPIFVDIDSRTFNLDTKKIEEKITKKTKAIIVIHLYGQPAEMDHLREIAEQHNLFLIEDACQAHGAEYKGKKVGGIGDIGCFSFYPTKNMTTGEGGMVTTNDSEIAEKIRLLRNHGQPKKYTHSLLGFNFRMTDIAAAIGIEQLKKLDKFNKIRTYNAKFLTKNLSDIKEITLPFVSSNVKHVFNQYTIRFHSDKISRNKLIQELDKNGIKTAIYYPLPIYKQPLYQKLGFDDHLPETEKTAKEVLSLPAHPALTNKDLSFIISQIKLNLG